MGFTGILSSGKLTKNYGKIHHAINGKIHYFDWVIFNSKLLNYQRVFPIYCGNCGQINNMFQTTNQIWIEHD